MIVLHRLACIVAVVPLVITFAMAATTSLSADATVIPRTTTAMRGYSQVKVTPTQAPLLTRSGKAMSTPGTNMTTSRTWRNGENEWRLVPSRMSWNKDDRIPMNQESAISISRVGRVDREEDMEEGRGKNKYYKKYKKYMLPLLLAYKLKFFTLVPILIGGLVLLTGATGLAGFFFALFAATMGLKGGGEH